MRRAVALIAISVMIAASCSTSPDGTSAATTTATIRIVNQNLLHGTACPADTNRCDLPHRVALFLRQLERAKCPEIVAIEEGNRQTVTELRKGLGACDYRLVYDDDPGQDREIVLTTLRVLDSLRIRLAGPLRTAYRVRLSSDAGRVDVIATHLASGSDDRPCDSNTCSPPCTTKDSVNTCQARNIVAEFLREDPPSARTVSILAGDLNAEPHGPTIAALTAAGLVDTSFAARNAECDPTTGNNCTSGRIDDSLIDMKNAASKQTERIDYVFMRPIRRCTIVRPTGMFAPTGGPTRRDGLVFPADHSGVEATIRCRTTDADRKSAALRVPSPTTTTAEGPVSSTDRAAITAAFTNLFAPNPDANVQLSTLEHGDALRESFIARKQQVGDLATKTSVRIESFDGQTSDVVRLTFSILLNGNVVLDHLPGQAKLIGGLWFVTTQSYCQVATLGMPTIPEPCK